ncbi:hypothetical protein CEXT_199141 [Caerostris extrusa]|uniref:Uncharacterized protein n=1 Tax=Caerostris extrusa TaxID=172846 RepID=A0AAV4WT66_CAEEX|nr:hypothetical protein CEXT_199141 [Caerostris extrusa]
MPVIDVNTRKLALVTLFESGTFFFFLLLSEILLYNRYDSPNSCGDISKHYGSPNSCGDISKHYDSPSSCGNISKPDNITRIKLIQYIKWCNENTPRAKSLHCFIHKPINWHLRPPDRREHEYNLHCNLWPFSTHLFSSFFTLFFVSFFTYPYPYTSFNELFEGEAIESIFFHLHRCTPLSFLRNHLVTILKSRTSRCLHPFLPRFCHLRVALFRLSSHFINGRG